MTYLFNDPAEFASDAVTGLALAHPDHVAVVHGGVVRATETPKGQPALVIGGGSGHYPAFAGWVGPGMGHGAPCGNVFASPSTSQVYSVARNAENGGGVILGFGNYAGDVLHFGGAAEKLRAEGIDVRIIKVSDDIVSNTPENHADRRGIAGDLPVFKIAGAAIEAGADLDEAERIALKANDATRSFGVAFDGPTLPGAQDALFHVPEKQMGVGLGIHGEPGVRDEPIGTAAEIAELLVKGILEEEPARREGGYNGRSAGGGYGPGPGPGARLAPRRRRGLWPLIIGLVLLVGVAPVVTIGGFIWSISSLAGDAPTGPVPMEGATAQIEVPANEMLIVYVPKADEATAECTAEGADPGAVTTVPSSSDTTFGNGEEYVQVLGIAAVQDTTVTVTCTGTDAPAHLGPYSMVSMAGPLLIGLVVGVLAGLIGLVLTVIGIVKLVRSRRA